MSHTGKLPHRPLSQELHSCILQMLLLIPSTGAAKGIFPLIWTITLKHKVSANCLGSSGCFILSVQNQSTATWWFMAKLTGMLTQLPVTLVCLQSLWGCWRHPTFTWVNLGEINLTPGSNFCCHLLPSSANISSERCAVTWRNVLFRMKQQLWNEYWWNVSGSAHGPMASL